jgi:4-amino-4-deoxy-L-arabinose transferase-like glycosyltransferase
MPSSPTPAAPADLYPVPLSAEENGLPATRPSTLASLGALIARHRLEFIAAVILLAGLALRILPCFGVPNRLTPDETYYMHDVALVKLVGPSQYAAIVEDYDKTQAGSDIVMLPPTRCMFILAGWAWDAVFHSGIKMSLRYVAATFSCLGLLLSGWFAFRLGGIRYALVVGALMAVAPMELVMAHRELMDGVFGFWALLTLWLLWENLQRPRRLGWLAGYAGAIAFLVLTKENAFFVAVALGGIIGTAALFPALNLGKVTWSTVAATAIGGLLGIAVLISISGGLGPLIETYRLLVTKAEKMDFAYMSGGGPWYRYIVDLMLVSPLVLLPAIGKIFALRLKDRQPIFLLLFVVFSCTVMVNVKNGMNLRYATMWDMPLRYLAAGTILQMAGAVRRWPITTAVILIGVIGAMELHQYVLIFVQNGVQDPITLYLMYALQIVRVAAR